MALRLVKNTEPYVQRFHEPYRETGMGPQGPAGVGLCVLCQPIISNIITMATFDVSGVLYRDPKTGCASTSDNQVAYEECRQSYYAKQQSQKTNTIPAEQTPIANNYINTELDTRINSLQNEINQIRSNTISSTNFNPSQQYFHIAIIGLLGVIAISLILITIKIKAQKQ